MLQKRLFGNSFPFYKQLDAMDCGPTCLRIISKFYGKDFSLFQLRQYCFITKQGVSLSALKEASEKLGFKALPVEIEFDVLQHQVALPCILHWNKKHFVVLFDINHKGVFVADPAIGKIRYTTEEFLNFWQLAPGKSIGRAILLETSSIFFEQPIVDEPKNGLKYLWTYLKPHKKGLALTIATLLTGSLLTLILPFLTQAIVDRGINAKDLSLIKLIILAQLGLVAGRVVMDVIRARLLFHLGTKVSIDALTSFLTKLMKLPFPFFDTRNVGDNIQRMQDNQKIEQFLTNSLINILLAIISIIVFGSVLAYYSVPIFFIFLIGSSVILIWTMLHANRRKILDYKTFNQSSANQSLLVETISAIQEIKLTECEGQKINQFRDLQLNSYQTKLESLKLDQRVQTGTQIFNELKNILIIYLAAYQVISGELSMGMMLSISYISGQLNSPIRQFPEFIRTAQNAGFSLKRMNEVHLEEDEDAGIIVQPGFDTRGRSIRLEKISFRYGDPGSPPVFKELSLEIPTGKTIALVGMSGSGKTTLLKLLLKFYHPSDGDIFLGEENFKHIHASQWRRNCGVVMQDGFIFADTIANNISVGHDTLDTSQLIYACKMANIHSFIEQLPFGFDTMIGKDGHGLSEGQTQRLLIARLVYRNPEFVFLDEATNSLDANNEKLILENLSGFFVGKTVIVVAHRLSTVKNADQIVLLDKGTILEQGSHSDLIAKKGAYFNLIRNQLELGK